MTRAAHPVRPDRRPARYVSDFTRFMDGFLEDHPEVVADRRRGWGIWWERKVDLREQERILADTVQRPPYSYE